MTVCIAAICQFEIEGIGNRPLVIGVSDRMLTSGDIEFEPANSKIYRLTSSMVALTAGDAAIQYEVCTLTASDILQRLSKDVSWIRVREAVDFYIGRLNEYRRKRVERQVLAPLGLNSQTFLQHQRELSPELAQGIINNLINSEPCGTETIIAGVDTSGPHIYVIDGAGNAACMDNIGFAAIGIGQRHAESQFMFSRYSPGTWNYARTLLLTYMAKKRAEVAPGVGTETDMFFIGPDPGTLDILHPDLLAKIDELYATASESISGAVEDAQKRIDDHVKGLIADAAAKAREQVVAGSPDGAAPTPTDEKELRDGVKKSKPKAQSG